MKSPKNNKNEGRDVAAASAFLSASGEDDKSLSAIKSKPLILRGCSGVHGKFGVMHLGQMMGSLNGIQIPIYYLR
jgi:hypothetical protein